MIFSMTRVALLASVLSLPGVAAAQPANAEPGSNTAPAADTVSLSLDEAVQLAQTRSFRVARSRRNERVSQLRYKSAKSAYYPRANFSVNGDQSARGFQYATDLFETNQPTQGEFRGGPIADISMPIDVAGVIKRQVAQADAQREISGQEIGQSGLDVTLEAQTNYLNALRAQNTVDAEERVVAEVERLLESSRSGAPGTVPFLEVELANAKQSRSSSRENADRAQEGLKQTLRLPPETRLRLTTSFTDRRQPFERENLLDRALKGRPDVQQALQRIRQSEISIRQSHDSRQPTLRVGGFYTDQYSGRNAISAIGGSDRFKNQGVGLNINLPIAHYDNGVLGRQKRIAQIQKEQAMADAEELQERVGYELRQALLAVERAENRLRTLPDREQAYQAMKRAEQSMLRAPFEQAQALLAQVTNARSAWRSAETASADAFIDYNSAIFRLKRIIGEKYVADTPNESVSSLPIMTTAAAKPSGGR
jgi:outer membrane protein TolC